MNDNFLNCDDFDFQPFNPTADGDSGVLQLATRKENPAEQYLVKSTYSDLACNEFMYHKVAATLGLYTQEAKLFQPSAQMPYAVGIHYENSARRINVETDCPVGSSNFADFIGFQALYVILGESDSEEYYTDSAGRLFKLDNAASFAVSNLDIMMLDRLPEDDAISMFQKKLNDNDYGMFSLTLQGVVDRHGEAGKAAYIAMIERFSSIDEAPIDEAVDLLGEVYPLVLSEYYYAFVQYRKALCGRFLSEIKTR